MTGVGEQRERPGDDSARDLGRHQRQDQAEGDGEQTAVARPRVSVGVHERNLREADTRNFEHEFHVYTGGSMATSAIATKTLRSSDESVVLAAQLDDRLEVKRRRDVGIAVAAAVEGPGADEGGELGVRTGEAIGVAPFG